MREVVIDGIRYAPVGCSEEFLQGVMSERDLYQSLYLDLQAAVRNAVDGNYEFGESFTHNFQWMENREEVLKMWQEARFATNSNLETLRVVLNKLESKRNVGVR